MAVPKRKVSKARRDKRRANWKLSLPGIAECPQCKQPKLNHRVCGECGYYDGKKVEMSADEKEKARKARAQ
ncbi:MAG: 50S ribosomal protein L32 [Christensenellales bacterium]|jgi:large subunit ribosomal protein L32